MHANFIFQNMDFNQFPSELSSRNPLNCQKDLEKEKIINIQLQK